MLAETSHDGAMQYSIAWGWVARMLFWPFLVVFAINIENLAAKEGVADVLAKRAGEFPAVISEAYALATSPTAFALAIFVGGVATNAWFQKFLVSLENGNSWFTRWNDSTTILSASDIFGANGFTRRISNTKIELPRLNKKLARLGLRLVPDTLSDDEAINRSYAKYLKAIYGSVQGGDLEEARRIGNFVLNHEESERKKRQSPLSIGPGTPP